MYEFAIRGDMAGCRISELGYGSMENAQIEAEEERMEKRLVYKRHVRPTQMVQLSCNSHSIGQENEAKAIFEEVIVENLFETDARHQLRDSGNKQETTLNVH